MDTNENKLITEHALLAVKFAKGDKTVVTRMKEIEEKLDMKPYQIAVKAADSYMGSY